MINNGFVSTVLLLSSCAVTNFFFAAVPSVVVDAASDLTVTVKPVRYCSDKGWWCKTRSYPWGQFWEDEGISGSDQDKIFMAYLADPPSDPADVKNIVFTTSGQQGSSGGADDPNVVSGFKDNWGWDTTENGDEPRTLDGRSLAVRFKANENNNGFSESDTLYITVANSMFNHMMWSSTKTKFLNAYAKFLQSHISTWSNVENIYLAGSSRGGCLVARLAQTLMDSYGVDNAKFTVHVVDGVCKYTQSEYGTTSSTIDNPNSSRNFKAYKTNIEDQVSNKNNMCMRTVVGGDEVTGLALGVRSFTHSSSSCGNANGCTLTDSNGDEYYKQTWHDLEHIEMGRDYAHTAVTVDNFLDHYENTCKVKFHS